MHGADHGPVERCVPKVKKEAGRGAAIIEAGPRRTDDQGRRKSIAARVVQMVQMDTCITCLIQKTLQISDV